MDDIMCYIIDSETILFNCFVQRNVDEISSTTLVQLKDKIESSFSGGSVYIDISANSIRNVVVEKRAHFQMNPTKVKLINPNKFHKEWTHRKLEDYCNWRMPERIKERCIQVITEVDGEV